MSEQQRRLLLQLREKDDIIRDQKEQIYQLRRRLVRLEIEKEERTKKYEYVGKSTKKVHEGMEPIYEKIKQKNLNDWKDIKLYLKKKLSNEEEELDPYKVREMTDFLNAKVFHVFDGIGKGRKKITFNHKDDTEFFTLTISKINGKGKYTVEQQLNNVAKAIDIHLHPDHGRIIFSKEEIESEKDEELADRKSTMARWYRITNSSSCSEKEDDEMQYNGGWRRIKMEQKSSSSSLSESD